MPDTQGQRKTIAAHNLKHTQTHAPSILSRSKPSKNAIRIHTRIILQALPDWLI